MSDSYDDYEAKMQLAEHAWEKRVGEMVKTKMDREDIIKLAREAGFKVDWQHADVAEIKAKRYEYFAALVADAEREAIAKSLDKQADLACDEIDRQWAQEMAAAVRARGNT